MAQNHIEGIHNYCDRWCERCFFTSRCAVYAMEAKETDRNQDSRNKAFWERLSENFTRAKQLIEEAAAKNGIDLNELKAGIEETQKKQEEIRLKSQDNPLSKLSLQYSEVAHGWLQTQPGMVEKLTELKEQLELGAESQEEAKIQTNTIRDCLEVIQWYETFIHVKFVRALMGKMNIFGDEDETFQHDYDGSAKIAMLAIDRSMQAWLKLYDLLPEQEDEFLKTLALLEKIKTLAQREFPKATEFIRPGFDS
jgi:hypothetical protein